MTAITEQLNLTVPTFKHVVYEGIKSFVIKRDQFMFDKAQKSPVINVCSGHSRSAVQPITDSDAKFEFWKLKDLSVFHLSSVGGGHISEQRAQPTHNIG